MASVRKRKYPDEVNEEQQEDDSKETEEVTENKRRRVMFENVRVFHFSRRQGHTCVPSQVRDRDQREVITQATFYVSKELY